MIYEILAYLDNTFIGTLLAGMILTLIGLSFYREQKKIDIKYDDLRKIRELASLLFANIEIASRKYEGRLGMHNGKNAQLKNIYDLLNSKHGDRFKNDTDTEFNVLSSKITLATDDLIARLKIEGNYDVDIKILIEKIPSLNFFLLGSTVFYLSKPEQIDEYGKAFSEVLQPIQTVLQKIIKIKNE